MLKFSNSFIHSEIIDYKDLGNKISLFNTHILYDISQCNLVDIIRQLDIAKSNYKKIDLSFYNCDYYKFLKLKKDLFNRAEAINSLTIYDNIFNTVMNLESLEELLDKYNLISFNTKISVYKKPFITNRTQFYNIENIHSLEKSTNSIVANLLIIPDIKLLVKFIKSNKSLQVLNIKLEYENVDNYYEELIELLGGQLKKIIYNKHCVYNGSVICYTKNDSLTNEILALDKIMNYHNLDIKPTIKSCIICRLSNNTIKLPCGNIYHKQCLLKYLSAYT
jgi:hypothetical protein